MDRQLYSFWIDRAQLAELKARVPRTGESVSDQIRAALDRALARPPIAKVAWLAVTSGACVTPSSLRMKVVVSRFE